MHWKKNLPKPPPNHPKPSPNLPQTLPKSSPNPPKSKKNKSRATKTTKVETKIGLSQCMASSWAPFLTPKTPQERPKSLPKAPKMERQTRKNRCLKTSRFQTRFFHGLGVIFHGFFDDFLQKQIAQMAKKHFCKNLKNSDFPLRKIDIFKVSKF